MIALLMVLPLFAQHRSSNQIGGHQNQPQIQAQRQIRPSPPQIRRPVLPPFQIRRPVLPPIRIQPRWYSYLYHDFRPWYFYPYYESYGYYPPVPIEIRIRIDHGCKEIKTRDSDGIPVKGLKWIM